VSKNDDTKEELAIKMKEQKDKVNLC